MPCHFNQLTKQTAVVVYLPELDIIELWVCMDVGVGNADELPSVGTLKLGRVQSLQHCYQRHIVLNTTREQTDAVVAGDVQVKTERSVPVDLWGTKHSSCATTRKQHKVKTEAEEAQIPAHMKDAKQQQMKLAIGEALAVISLSSFPAMYIEKSRQLQLHSQHPE